MVVVFIAFVSQIFGSSHFSITFNPGPFFVSNQYMLMFSEYFIFNFFHVTMPYNKVTYRSLDAVDNQLFSF